MNASWIVKWRGLRVFILGDVMLDKYVNGHVERISPEAPIPILHHQTEKAVLGGAAMWRAISLRLAAKPYWSARLAMILRVT
jgi:bifunctional ADP-heptose synthase (sugar kinase/adenylyltransferase)